MATDGGKDPGIAWGIAGSSLVLAGMLVLLIAGIADAGAWRHFVIGPLVIGGGACTLMSFLVRRRAGRDHPDAKNASE